jgi:hypothetical protein
VGREDHARRAEAALEPVLRPERVLERVQRTVRRGRPSMVVTEAPSACTARQVHDFTATPSRSTVHDPHWLVSQPTFVPVRPRKSRSQWTSSSRGSPPRAAPAPPGRGPAARARGRSLDPARACAAPGSIGLLMPARERQHVAEVHVDDERQRIELVRRAAWRVQGVVETRHDQQIPAVPLMPARVGGVEIRAAWNCRSATGQSRS